MDLPSGEGMDNESQRVKARGGAVLKITSAAVNRGRCCCLVFVGAVVVVVVVLGGSGSVVPCSTAAALCCCWTEGGLRPELGLI